MTENYVETLKKSLLMGINSVGLILTENDGFDPKRPENSFFTPVDMVWPVLTRWTRFWSEMTVLTRNSFFTLVDMVWPVLTRWTRFWSKMTVLTRNSFFTLIDMVWPVLTRWTRFWWKNTVDSRKIYFEF